MMHCVEGNRFSTRHVCWCVSVCLCVIVMRCLLIKLIFPNDWSGEKAVLGGKKNTLWFTAVHRTHRHAALNLLWFCNCLLLYMGNTWPRTPAAWTFGPHMDLTWYPQLRCDMTKHMRAKSWPHMLWYIFRTGGKSWLVGNKVWYLTQRDVFYSRPNRYWRICQNHSEGIFVSDKYGKWLKVQCNAMQICLCQIPQDEIKKSVWIESASQCVEVELWWLNMDKLHGVHVGLRC